MSKKAITALLIAVLTHCSRSSQAAEEPRFTAMLADGTRVAADEVRDWHDTASKPKLGDRELLDPKNPLRWLRDTRVELATTPAAYVEMWGGDRVPGKVLSSLAGNEATYERLPQHVVVDPDVAVNWPDPRQIKPVHIATRWLKRVVWQSRGGERYVPATAFYRDGRQTAFRSLRWQGGSVRLLLAEGTADVPFSQLAELHLPAQNSWDAYVAQLAVLSPDGAARLLRAETDTGLRLTGSWERFQAKNNGSHPDHWFHALQPAWALEPIWMRHRSIGLRCSFAPHEPPLSLFEPERVQQKATLGAAWSPLVDRHAGGGPLRAKSQDFGWGWGVNAHSSLTFDLPPAVKRFRTLAALDDSVGNGGCVMAKAFAGDSESKPLFQTPHLVGSNEIADSGWLEFPSSGPRKLVLVADAAHESRPAGADPLDIRDRLDWLEPQVQFDAQALRQAAANELATHMPAWQGWTLEQTSDPPAKIVNLWNDADVQDLHFEKAVGPAPGQTTFALNRTLKPNDENRLLLICAHRLSRDGRSTKLEVRIGDDKPQAFDVPERRNHGGHDPLAISLDKWLGQEVRATITQRSEGPTASVVWESIVLGERWPGLHRIVDDEPETVELLRTGGETVKLETEDRHVGQSSLRVTPAAGADPHRLTLSLPIREHPRLGEFRFIRFAWKTPGNRKARVCLSLEHDNAFGPDGESRDSRRRSFRYDAGVGDASYGAALRLDRTSPEKWVEQTRDLFGDFGEFTLTGISFSVPEGEAALFDHVYLGRSWQDLDRAKRQPGE